MSGTCTHKPINVAGMVIHVKPEKRADVMAALALLPGVDVHAATDDHRLVATAIDTEDTMAIEQLAAMNRIPGVVTAMLAYHQIDHADETAPCACAAPADISPTLIANA